MSQNNQNSSLKLCARLKNERRNVELFIWECLEKARRRKGHGEDEGGGASDAVAQQKKEESRVVKQEVVCRVGPEGGWSMWRHLHGRQAQAVAHGDEISAWIRM